MPRLPVNGTELYYEERGSSDEAILFSHGLLWSGRMFEAQVDALSSDYRVITYDHRGQGRSAKPKVSSISIEQNYEDAVALIEALAIGPCHFAGLSMGGFVAMRLAARRPDLLRSLILMETSAEPEPKENLSSYAILNLIARCGGLRLVAPKVMKIMFGKSFLEDPARAEERERWKRELQSNERTIYRAVNGVLEREGMVDQLSQITCPTTIIVGEEDVATVPAKSERMHSAIAGSRLVRIPKAGHSSCIEQAELVTNAIREHLASQGR